MIKREEYLNKLKSLREKQIIKVITGVRRCGKSTLFKLYQEHLLDSGVLKEQIISINLDDLEFEGLLNYKELYTYIKKHLYQNGYSYIFIDEVQNCKDFEKVVNSLFIKENTDIYITGSNAMLLSGELATHLSGRYIKFNMYPLSFKEFNELFLTVYPNIGLNESFKKYLVLGGMPILYHLSFDEKASKQYLIDQFDAIVLKEVVKRNNIRDIGLLEKIIAFVYNNIGNTFSANSISKYFKDEGTIVAVETVLNYLNAIESARLIHKVRREEIRTEKLIYTNEKYYAFDHGLIEALCGEKINDELLLENIIYLEALRRGYKVTVGKIYDKEVNFVFKKGDKVIYLQVVRYLYNEDTIEKQFGVFEKIRDNYPKYIVSLDEIDMSKNGIVHKNIIDFLLKKDW